MTKSEILAAHMTHTADKGAESTPHFLLVSYFVYACSIHIPNCFSRLGAFCHY